MQIRSFPMLALFFCRLCYGQAAETPPSVTAVRIQVPPRIDGRLDDSVWKLATPATDFRQREPLDGEPASERTEIRVLYDAEALYFGCMYFDSEPGRIVARLARRDDEDETDRGSIRIDSFHDHQNAFEFTFNPAGVKVDILQFDDGDREDASWDPVWELETQITADGWSAEIKIPFSILRYTTADGDSTGQAWGINFTRTIHRKQEGDRWSYTPISMDGFVSRFGHLVGLDSLPHPRRIEVKPFGLARQQWIPATESHDRFARFSADGGVDLKIGISNSFILDATVNPDFGQVEADPAVLNLSTIETFYPEQRPFFVEGTQILRFSTFGDGDGSGPGLFYSRRIGRALGEENVELEENEKTTDVPLSTTILGAVKLTGKTNSGLSVGILEAFTAEEHAIIDSAGKRKEQLMEPRAGYNVIRLRQDVLDGSTIGLIATSVVMETRLPALTGGVDWNLRLADQSYQLDGFLAGSHTSDADGARMSGAAGRVSFARTSNLHWLWSVSTDFTTKRYNINDVGFFRRPNDYGGMATVRYRENAPAAVVRNYSLLLTAHERENFDGANLYRNLGLEGGLTFMNYWGTFGFIQAGFGRYDDRETRGNGLYRRPRTFGAGLSINSDDRQNVKVDVEQELFADDKRGRSSKTWVELELRPVPWMRWDLEGEFEAVNVLEAWVDNVDLDGVTTSVFGDRTTRSFSATVRGGITFTRDLTVQLYTQLFTAKGHHENFRRLLDVSTFEPYPYQENADFNEQSFNLNVVLRWEYLPGSTVFFVWSQARTGESGDYFTSLSDDLARAFQVAPSNVVMVKATFWWNL